MRKQTLLLFLAFALIISSYFVTKHTTSSPKRDSTNQEPIITAPILITSLGQSIDYIMLERILDNLNSEYDSLPRATYEDMMAYNTILAVVGSSKKAMSFSDISLDSELNRIEVLHESIIDNDTQVILIHMGGKNRRGLISDEIINVALPLSSSMIVVEDGNFDNLFTDYAQENHIWSSEVQDMHELQNLISSFMIN